MTKRFFGIMLLLCAVAPGCFAQLWSGILAPARATDWTQAGIPGGIPSGSWPQCGASIAPYTGSPALIVNAMMHMGAGYTSCSPDSYIQLQAGTFHLSGAVYVVGTGGTELRGMGAGSTFLDFTAATTCQGGNGTCGIGFQATDGTYPTQTGGPAYVYSWTNGFTQGATSITVSSGVAIVAGQTEVVMDQCDTGYSGNPCTGNSIDNGNAFACSDGYGEFGSTYGCSVAGPDSGFARPHRFTMEEALVTSCSPSCGSAGSTVLTLDRPLIHATWSSAQTPQVWLLQPQMYVGVQNLTVEGAGTTMTGGVSFSNDAYFWVNGVAVLDSYNIGIWLEQSSRGIVQSNYVYNAGQTLAYGDPTGIKHNWDSNLIQNNIVQDVRPFIQEEGPAAGSVIAYNFGINSYTGNDFLFSGLLSHSTGDDLNLYEGNITDQDTLDQIHGSHLFQTSFRNLFTGWESCGNGNCGSYAHKDSNVAAVLDLSYNRFYQSIDNVVGSLGGPATAGYAYQGQAYPGAGGVNGYPYYLNSGDNAGTYKPPADPLVNSTFMIWGDWDAHNAAILFCTAAGTPVAACPANFRGNGAPGFPALASPAMTFPASFYLASGRPSWYAPTVPFPLIGGDVTGGNLGQCGGVRDASGQFGGVASISSGYCAGQGLNMGWAGHANANPAMLCALSLGMPPDGSGAAIPFDASTCYGALPTAATPVIAPSSGTPPQTATLTCVTPGCQIYYTEDGSTPTTSSSLYSTPLSITVNPTTLNAIGFAAGYNQSAMASALFSGLPTAATPSPSLGTGTYAYNTPVTLSTTSPGCSPYIWWSSSNPPTTASGNNSGGFFVRASITIYWKVINCPGYADSAVGSANYTLATPAPGVSLGGSIIF